MYDYLFVTQNCDECDLIKSIIKPEVFQDDTHGNSGQLLVIVHTYSNAAVRHILDHFGLVGKFTPVILSYTGQTIDSIESIIAYLQEQGFCS